MNHTPLPQLEIHETNAEPFGQKDEHGADSECDRDNRKRQWNVQRKSDQPNRCIVKGESTKCKGEKQRCVG